MNVGLGMSFVTVPPASLTAPSLTATRTEHKLLLPTKCCSPQGQEGPSFFADFLSVWV